MEKPHLLHIGNPRKVKSNLTGVIPESSLALIEQEICRNVAQFLQLARHHFNFASRLNCHYWRQSISRAYFGAYCASRAIRLFVSGDYSQEVRDHCKFSDLPDDFPNRARYGNQLMILREDRNLSDYDHTATARNLAIPKRDALILVGDFLTDAGAYLEKKGMRIR